MTPSSGDGRSGERLAAAARSADTPYLVGASVLDRYWYATVTSAELTDVPVAFRLLGRDHVLWRTSEGDVRAADDRCPHREAPLSLGRLEEGCLTCTYHGWRFDGDGRCVEVPSAGATSAVPPKAHLRLLPVREAYGLVWLCPGTPTGDLPAIPQDADPTFRRLNPAGQVWRTCALRMVDNFLDISHFPYVHAGTFGLEQETVVPPIDVGPLADGYVGYAYDVRARNDEQAHAATGVVDDVVEREMTTGFVLPTTVRSTIRYADGLEHIILLLSTPVDDLTTQFNFVVWRNDDRSIPAEEILAFDLAIGAEDRAMLERVPGRLPLDVTDTVSVQADRPSVEWRRRLAALLEEPAGDR